jgi:ketosteroid isomerase-like protein
MGIGAYFAKALLLKVKHSQGVSRMAEHEFTAMSGKELFEGLVAAFIAKDVTKALSYFADDAIFYDPHYPQPRMVGKDAIRQGLEWGIRSLEKPGLTLRHLWLDGNSGVAETDTHHIIKGGMEAKFDQVFVFEIRDGKFTRVQSYVPYPPHGIAGMIGNATKLMWRLRGKIK